MIARRSLFVVIVSLVAIAARADEARLRVEKQSDVMVRMRDGVSLATDIYLPAGDGKSSGEKRPTILMRTPYSKAGSPADGEYFASHGYAFVVQDTRGRYASGGVWHMLTDDGRDGFDTCDWIGRQPWSNGKVGTIGTSYVGGTQHALAMERPPQLVTAIPVDAMSDPAAPGHHAAEAHSRVRRLARRGDGTRSQRRLLEAEQHPGLHRSV
jgi:putative CocE/NonD family hydrolase